MIILYAIAFILLLYIFRAITVWTMIQVAQRRINKRIIKISDNLPDERSKSDLGIAINNISWYLNNLNVVEDFLHLFRKLDSTNWINPELLNLLYEYYQI